MNLAEIKSINQRIYELDTEISRNAKLIFVACIVFCSLNDDFRKPDKMTSVIDFANSNNPISDMVDLAKKEVKKLVLDDKTYNAVSDSLDIIYGVSTKLHKNRVELQSFVYDFVMNKIPLLTRGDNLFFETLYMEVDKKAKNNDKGITLTPYFAAGLMVDLADINYRDDIIVDIASGTGLFSILSYSTMINQLEADRKNLTQDEYLYYKNKISKSIIANDYDAKMVTLTLANFILKNLNVTLIKNFDVFELKKSDFSIKNDGETLKVLPTKAILNPPYEDAYKPVEIVYKTIELLKNNATTLEKVIVIIPSQKFAQKKDVFYKILNLSRLDCIVKMQNDLFADSGQSPATSIFVFDLTREHRKTDEIRYFDFSDSGFVFLKDSGMVDKKNTFKAKKEVLLGKINGDIEIDLSFKRTWTNFYDVSHETEIIDKIDPSAVKISKENADITFENATIKKMLKEKASLLEKCDELYCDDNGEFVEYLVKVLSGD